MIIAGLVLFVASLGSLSYATAPISRAHANPTLWFISYMDTNTGYSGLTYTYTFSWGDTQSQTITISSNWGDGTTDMTTSTGFCCDPPTAYSKSVTIGHVYTKTGVFIDSITLSDSTGASVTRSTTITVTDPDPTTPQVFTGGLGGHPLVPN